MSVRSFDSAGRLASPEGDDASDRVVRRDTHGNPIAGDDLDAEAAHPAAQLGQYFVAGIHLHAIEAAAVHGNHSALDINEIVLAQIRSPFNRSSIAQCPQRPVAGSTAPVFLCYLMEIPAESRVTRLRTRAGASIVAVAGRVR